MRKSLSAPCLTSLGTAAPAKPMPRVISCKAVADIASDVALAWQLESATHAPAYKVGLCMIDAMQQFPDDILRSADLPTCLATFDDTYEKGEVFVTKQWRVEENTERAGELLARVRRRARGIGGGGKG